MHQPWRGKCNSGCFEEEVEAQLQTWGDLGEAVYEMDAGNETDSDISTSIFYFIN